MRRFKEQIGSNTGQIETFEDVGTRFIKNQEFKKDK